MKLRKFSLAILILLVIAGGLAGIKVLQIKTMVAAASSMAPHPEAVATFVAHRTNWPVTLGAIASISAVQGVIITPEIPGAVQNIAFESGTNVSTGDLLVRLNTSSEEAQLSALEAQVELAKLNVERVRTLAQQNMVSQSDLDTAEATLKEAAGNADAIRATIAKKTIRAPFSGQLGIRRVNLGEYVDVGKPIVSLQSLSPVYADFTLPQQEVPRLTKGMKVTLSTDAYPGREFSGFLSAINPDLDTTTRSVRLQATFDNPEQLLRPGMFARAEVVLPEDQTVTIVPTTSIIAAPYGDSVYLVESKADDKGNSLLVARQQFVRTGRARGDFVAVETGLKPGEKVVSAGAFKLRNGIAVKENNELVPKTSETPHPADA
jgi:membrane fusion protein (multidrug efflux system)